MGWSSVYPYYASQMAPTPPPVQLRAWKGNICGVHVPGLPAVAGGAADASLVLSWFYDRYSAMDRTAIRAAWHAAGLTHVQLSWPNSRSIGQSPAQFIATNVELMRNGFATCPFMCSKDFDPPDMPTILADALPLMQQLHAAGVRMFCVGWELSIWLSPTQVQQLIDAMALVVVPDGGLLYVHFQAGYASFPQPQHDFASFWNANIGKLTGLLHQKPAEWIDEEYQYRLVDILDRFSGKFNCSPDSGFGHPFDLIAFEVTASQQFAGSMTTADGNRVGAVAMAVPPVVGPTGISALVNGYGNGA